MPRNLTPHGVEIPPNPNRLGRPPGQLRTDLPGTRELLTDPGLYDTLHTALRRDPNDPNAVALLTDLAQHRRAMNGERVAPGDYLGDSRFPTEQLPFANREQYRPDRAPGTRDHDLLRKAVETLDATHITEALQQRMGTDARPAEASTWDRCAPSSERASASSGEPSLRDSIQGAASLFKE